MDGDSDSRRRTLTVAETAEIIGLGRNATYEAIRRGEIPSLKLGGKILVSRRVIDRMLDGGEARRDE